MIITELLFDLNAMVELERRFGGSLRKAIKLLGRGKQLTTFVEAFTRHLTPAPTTQEIRAVIQQQGETVYRKLISDGFVTPLLEGISITLSALPEPYHSLEVTDESLQRLERDSAYYSPRQAVRFLRHAVWIVLVSTNHTITEEEIGRQIRPVHFHPLGRAYEQAVDRYCSARFARGHELHDGDNAGNLGGHHIP